VTNANAKERKEVVVIDEMEGIACSSKAKKKKKQQVTAESTWLHKEGERVNR